MKSIPMKFLPSHKIEHGQHPRSSLCAPTDYNPFSTVLTNIVLFSFIDLFSLYACLNNIIQLCLFDIYINGIIMYAFLCFLLHLLNLMCVKFIHILGSTCSKSYYLCILSLYDYILMYFFHSTIIGHLVCFLISWLL